MPPADAAVLPAPPPVAHAHAHAHDLRGAPAGPPAVGENAAPPPRAPLPERTNCLWVGGLACDVSDDVLRAYFEDFGALADVHVVRDAHTRRSKGFAYVSYHTPDDAERALHAVHDLQLAILNRPVRAKPTAPRQPRDPARGGGGRGDRGRGALRGGGRGGGGGMSRHFFVGDRGRCHGAGRDGSRGRHAREDPPSRDRDRDRARARDQSRDRGARDLDRERDRSSCGSSCRARDYSRDRELSPRRSSRHPSRSRD